MLTSGAVGVVAVDRWARARFTVIRINRWSLAFLLLGLLALLLYPTRGFLPVLGQPAMVKVKQGVTLYNRDFSGVTEAEARDMLAQMAGVLQSSPVPARETVQNGISYVEPELNGATLDVDMTWFRLSVAGEGSRVEPATKIQSPAKRLADFPLSAIRQGNSKKPAVALLVNVDWGTNELSEMLSTLKRRGVHLTFFVSGRWAAENKELLKQMADDGHEIGTHGYDLTYGPLDLVQAGKLKADIARSVETITGITGRVVRYYAPHRSELSKEILQTAADLKLRTVLYSLDTIDWRADITPEKILATLGRAKAGDLILMHPKPNTARVLEQGIIQLQSRGLEPTTLTAVINPDPGTPSEVWQGPHE